MKKQRLFTGIMVSLICVMGFSQSAVNQYDANGKRHGLWTKNYHNTDQVRYKGVFKHGKEVDSFKYYTLSSGKSVLSAVKVFREKDSLADVSFFASNKKVISEGKMNGKRFIGEWVFYHKNSSAKMIVENYNDEGLLLGERFVYYKNGLLAESAHYKDGKLHGEAKWFTEQNKLIRQSYYKEDQLDGETKYYDADENLTSEGEYTKDRKSGIWKYYQDGKVVREVDHTNQKVISKEQ
ncbi:MORN repeat protein [Winogradskyella epiphytica]|uniref:MORN repeat protein n=1 Tax=Winogradskyella epiphytica TaxID=262005 RepID=A0A2V4XFP3_9FLAO|nr:toxin-antitoxin system YwqK family antitoxin [Winogradskyella epiphytica]PYE79604.1 MORN repeat protein [Winogradskyella epiphytica]